MSAMWHLVVAKQKNLGNVFFQHSFEIIQLVQSVTTFFTHIVLIFVILFALEEYIIPLDFALSMQSNEKKNLF